MKMTTKEKERLLSELAAKWETIADDWGQVPQDGPLPDTPEMIDLLTELVLALHGPALKELEKH